MFFQRRKETIISPGEIHRGGKLLFCRRPRLLLLLLLLLLFAGEGRSEEVSSLPLFLFWRDGTGRDDAGRVPDGRSVVMTGSGPKLGVLLLLAVLLQTVVVTITVLHFTTALNSVRDEAGGSDARWLLRIAEQRAARSRAPLEEPLNTLNTLTSLSVNFTVQKKNALNSCFARSAEHEQSRTRLISLLFVFSYGAGPHTA